MCLLWRDLTILDWRFMFKLTLPFLLLFYMYIFAFVNLCIPTSAIHKNITMKKKDKSQWSIFHPVSFSNSKHTPNCSSIERHCPACPLPLVHLLLYCTCSWSLTGSHTDTCSKASSLLILTCHPELTCCSIYVHNEENNLCCLSQCRNKFWILHTVYMCALCMVAAGVCALTDWWPVWVTAGRVKLQPARSYEKNEQIKGGNGWLDFYNL